MLDIQVKENLSQPQGMKLRNERDSSIELFRIITMLLIIAHHYVVHSGLMSLEIIYSDPTSWRSMFLLLFAAWGKTGINCFVMITGYFMCKSNITLKKFLKLLLEIYFYQIVIYLVFLLTGFSSFSVVSCINAIFPIRVISTNFIGCYLIFFLCIPFLNILVHNMTKRQHTCLLLLMGTIYILLGTIPKTNVIFNYITWFCILYFISSYIRLYPKTIFDRTNFWGWTSLIILLIASASVIICTWLLPKIEIESMSSISFWFVADSNKILAVAMGISSFLFFKNLRIKPNRFINVVASTTFGILLIHDNSDEMRQWLWKDVLNNVEMYRSDLLVIHAILVVIGIFTICSTIDYCRIRFIEKPLFKKYSSKISSLKSLF